MIKLGRTLLLLVLLTVFENLGSALMMIETTR